MSENPARNIFGTFLIIAIIISFVFSVLSLLRLDEVNERLSAFEAKTIKDIQQLEERTNSEIAAIKRLISGGGPIEDYLVARNFIENTEHDLRIILTELQENPERPYFRVFVAGSKEVWIGFKKSAEEDKYSYQKNFKPGLSNEKFFYLKAPLLETGYTITLSKDAYIRTAIPDAVYLLFFGFNSAKIAKMPAGEVQNITKDFNLYIPGE